MKKALRIILPFVIFGILTTLITGIRKKLKTKRALQQATSTLPVQPYLDSDSTAHALENPKHQTVFVLFFNSDCDYCQNEVKLLNKNREAFKDATVYLFSTEPLESIETFKNKYLPDNTDFIVGKIDALASSEVFGVKSVPYMLIYDKNNDLVNIYKGIVKLEALTQYID